MKLKTFFISYVVFLSTLLGAITIVSIYLTNHQINSITEQNLLEFERITSALEREINAVYTREQNPDMIQVLIDNQIEYHEKKGMTFKVREVAEPVSVIKSHFKSGNDRHLLVAQGTIETDLTAYHISIGFDVTHQMLELQQIKKILFYILIFFSLFSALILYVTLNKIFKPLETVALVSEKIAQGNYQERMEIHGGSELALMARNFNEMAIEIENHISLLESDSRRKQQFIDNLAHELRTPLTSILAFSEYMEIAKLTEEEILESAIFIKEEAGYMKRLINSMLELARLKNYRPVLENIPVEKMFKQVVSSLKLTMTDYEVEFMIESAEGKIQGQPDLIKSLITNLCINAAKASESGEVIRLNSAVYKNKTLVSVTDSGCGIASKHHDQLMEPFYQVDPSRNKENGGIGLGLAIVAAIADIHHASVRIESEIDKGTKVSIEFTTSI